MLPLQHFSQKKFEISCGQQGEPEMQHLASWQKSDAFKDMRDLNLPWRQALHMANKKNWPRGHYVPICRHLYFLERGTVRLTQQNMDGQEKILWFIGENCIFGETPFFHNANVCAHFTCVTNCTIHAFSTSAFETVMREYPELMLDLTRSMALKMRFLVRQVASLTLDNALVRVCRFLEQHIVPDSDPLLVDMCFSRQDIASFLGINRSSLYKLLREQEEKGLLKLVSPRKVIIMRPDIFYEIIAC